MPGREARAGFYFSDLVLIERVLLHLIEHRAAKIEGRSLPTTPLFRVEAPAHPEARPEWDVLEEYPSQVPMKVLEEVKSGPVDAEDRRTLWRRIRRTVASLDQTGPAKIVPRLTVNGDDPPDHPERWKALAGLSQSAPWDILPTSVRSEEDLAAEALYWLTHLPKKSDAKPGEQQDLEPVLTEVRAREILSAFEYHDAYKETVLGQQTENLIGVLSQGLALTAVRDLLTGELFRRAQAADETLHSFRPHNLWASVEILQRLSEVLPDAALCWQRLVRLGGDAAPQYMMEGASALPYQEWRRVQPTVAFGLDSPEDSRFVLTGRGGLGKSILLEQLAREARASGRRRVLHFHGNALRAEGKVGELGAGLELGRFLAMREGRSLEVFIDSFEDIADTPARQRDCLAEVGGLSALGSARVVLTSRTTAWKSLSGAQSEVVGWRQIELSDWDVEVVESLVAGSERPRLSADILQLLRTPLFLDLFLRTFRGGESVPATLHTRHAIISAFWNRRVLPPDHPESGVRREALLRCAFEEAAGTYEHSDVNQVLVGLTGEGVFQCRSGTFRFRHILLRDFALARWALSPEGGIAVPAKALVQIQDRLVLWGATRAIFEAVCEEFGSNSGSLSADVQVPNLGELIQDVESSAPDALSYLAEVLGELGLPVQLGGEQLPEAFASPSSAERFIDRILHVAQILAKESWLIWVSGLPDGAIWFDRTPWVAPDLLVRSALLLEAVWKSFPLERRAELRPIAQAAAQRIREWSRAGKLQDNPTDFEDRLMFLMPLVAQHAPGARTLEWLAALGSRSLTVRMGALEALPYLVSGARLLGQQFSSEAVANLFITAGGLKWVDGVLVPDPETPELPNGEHLRTSVALLGQYSDHSKPHGLLETLPQIFLPVVFGFLAGMESQRQARRTQLREDLTASLLESELDTQVEPEVTEIGRLERVLALRTLPHLPMEEIFGGLVDDTGGGYIGTGNYERSLIVSALKSRLRNALDSGDSEFPRQFWAAAKAGRSAAAWLLLLEELTQSGGAGTELVDELLVRRPLYHLYAAQTALHLALSVRWRFADAETRGQILQRIAEVVRTPLLNGIYLVTPLLSALPEDDHPEELREFARLYQLRGWDARPKKRQPDYPTWGGEFVDSSAEAPQSSVDVRLGWKGISSQLLGLARDDVAGFDRALCAIKHAVASGLPTVVDLGMDNSPLSIVHGALERLAQARKPSAALRGLDSEKSSFAVSVSDFSRDEISVLARWALGVMRSVDSNVINADEASVSVEDSPASGGLEPWKSALRLLDEALVHPSAVDELKLHHEFLDEMRRVCGRPSPAVAWYLFAVVRPWHWLHPAVSKRALLWDLLSEKVTDPGALYPGSQLVVWLPAEQAESLLRKWLCGSGGLPATAEATRFVSRLGILIGAQSLFRLSGERRFWAYLVEELLQSPPRVGALSERKSYLDWVAQLVFGAKNAFLCQPPSLILISDYVGLFAACWRQLGGALEYAGVDRVLIWAFDPISKMVSAQNVVLLREFWSRMGSTACAIIASREWSEVQWLFFKLRENAQLGDCLGAEAMMEVMEAIHTKAELVSRLSSEASKRTALRGASHSTLEYAAELAAHLGTLASTSPRVKDRLFGILQFWAEHGVSSALVAARNISARQ